MTFLNNPATTQTFAEGKAGVPEKKLFVAWLAKEKIATLQRKGWMMAANGGITEATDVALHAAEDKETTGLERGYAVSTLPFIGDKETVAKLEKLRADETPVARAFGAKAGDILIKDLALGVSIILSGQEPADYGFDRYKGKPKGAAAALLFRNLSLPEAAREAAFKKWKDWEAAQKEKK